MNKFSGIGKVAKAIEVNGKVGTITIAFKREIKEQDGSYKSDFFKFKVFGKSIEVIQKYTSVGDTLYVEASVRNNNWTSQDGTKHYDIDFLLNNFEFVSKAQPKEQKQEIQPVQQAPAPQPKYNVDDNDLPF